MPALEPISPGSVADLAYRRIRGLIETGELPPSARLSQGELAHAFGISRTTVREALHRLTAEDLVEFQANRGFFVASLRLDTVLARLELRLLLEPGIAAIAAERRTENDIAELRGMIETQLRTKDPRLAHDMSRGFHIRLARSTRNTQFVRVLDSLWSLDVGRQLLARRLRVPTWREEDAAEHTWILDAVALADPMEASRRMEEHVDATLRHWRNEAALETAPDSDPNPERRKE